MANIRSVDHGEHSNENEQCNVLAAAYIRRVMQMTGRADIACDIVGKVGLCFCRRKLTKEKTTYKPCRTALPCGRVSLYCLSKVPFLFWYARRGCLWGGACDFPPDVVG